MSKVCEYCSASLEGAHLPGCPSMRSEEGGPCANCGKNEATMMFSYAGSALDFVHGNYEWWCKLCVVQTQLEYARDLAAKIPELEAELKELQNE